MTSYTSLNRLEGATSKTDYNAGGLILDELMETRPNSVFALGFYLVDHLPVVPSGPADRKIKAHVKAWVYFQS